MTSNMHSTPFNNSPRPWKRPKLASELTSAISPTHHATGKDQALPASSSQISPINAISPSKISSAPQNTAHEPFSFESDIPRHSNDSNQLNLEAAAKSVSSLHYPVIEFFPTIEEKDAKDETARYIKMFDHQVTPEVSLSPNSQSLVPFTAALSDDSDFGEGFDFDSDEEDEFSDARITLSQTELLRAMAVRLNQGKPVDLVSLRVEVTPAAAKEIKMYLWMNGPYRFLQKYVYSGLRQHTLGEILAALSFPLPENLVTRSKSEELIELVRLAVQYTVRPRRRLPESLTLSSLAEKIENARNIIVLTGAGISTSLGIPDFRSKSGLYNKLSYLGLSDPQEVFDLSIFQNEPSIFYSIAKEILPVTTKFSPTHAFIKLLQDKGKLLRNYTQNIDNLEYFAGIKTEKLVQCHGSFATATCQTCGFQTKGENLFDDIRNSRIAKCPKCAAGQVSTTKSKKHSRDDDSDDESFGGRNSPIFGVMKPDITFFGEALPDKFEQTLIGGDADICDLLLCIGTSLKVSPVSETVRIVPPSVPQIYISKEPIHHNEFDLTFLGPCDDVIEHLCQVLDWKLDHPMMKNRPYEGEVVYQEDLATYEFRSREAI